MSLTAEAVREAAAAAGMSRVLVSAPFVQTHGCNSEPEGGVRQAYDMFLRLDGQGPHFYGARAWSQVRTTKTVEPTVFMLQLMLLLCETHTQGSMRPLVGADSRDYKRTVFLASKKICNYASTEEYKDLQERVVCDAHVDHRFSAEVKACCESIRAYMMGGGNQPGAADQAQPVGRPAARSLHENFTARSDENNIQLVLQRARVHYTQWARGAHSAPQPAARPAPAAGAGGRRQQNNNKRKKGYQLTMDDIQWTSPNLPEGQRQVTPKIQLTATPVPRAGCDPLCTRPEDTAGIFVRFLVRDPCIDADSFFRVILRNREHREQRIMAASARFANAGRGSELFGNYVSMFASSLHPASNHVTDQTYFRAALELCPELQHVERNALYAMTLGGATPQQQAGQTGNPLALKHVLSLDRALRVLADAGADATAFGRMDVWFDAPYATARFPPQLRTYKYHPNQVFWYNPKYIGLSEQFFPQMDMQSDFITSLVSGAPIDGYLEMADGRRIEDRAEIVATMRGVFDEMQKRLRDDWLVDRALVRASSLLTYQTGNEFVHRAKDAERIFSAVMKEYPAEADELLREVQALRQQYGSVRWKDSTEAAALRDRIAAYQRFCQILGKAQDECMKGFTGLWQTEGNIDDLPVPKPTKAMLTWYRNNHAAMMPNFTREFTMWDADLGFFGNVMLRQLKMYAGVGKIVQPLMCLVTHGLLACNQYTPMKLGFNMLVYGRYDVGKTFTAIGTLLKFTTIPGTTVMYTSQTDASETTQNHCYGEIRVSDEVPKWKVNVREAEKNPTLVNRFKVMMTNRQNGHLVFVPVRLPSGDDVRWNQVVTTDYYASLLEVTNETVDANNALASRYFRITMAQTNVPLGEMEGKMGAAIQSATITYLQMQQYVTAAYWHAEQCGAVRAPDMQLFHDLSARIMQYLHSRRVISQEVAGQRCLEIMLPYARQLVVQMAAHMAFDLPNSPHYRKKFEPWMLKDMQQFCYCTTDIVWWVWTALGSNWIEETHSQVIRAACKAAGIDDWSDGTTPYQMYERDVENQIPWRVSGGGGGRRKNKDAEERMIDIRYLSFKGDYTSICRRIANETDSFGARLGWTDVSGVLRQLATRQIEMGNCDYAPQPIDTFAKWHKYKHLPRKDPETGAHVEGEKRTQSNGDVHEDNVMPAIYTRVNSNSTKGRTEDDVPRMGAAGRKAFAADLSDSQYVHIMPHVEGHFRIDVIVRALEWASISHSMRPGKMMLGTADQHYPMLLKSYPCPGELISEFVDDFDRADGWIVNPMTGELDWRGDPNTLEEERPVSRRVGIAFNRRGGLSESDGRFFTAVPTAPVGDDDTRWLRQAEQDVARLRGVRDISTDLDGDSARRQWLAIGGDLDGEIPTPDVLDRRYRAACRLLGRMPDQGMNYPHTSLADMEDRNAIWESTAQSSLRAADLSAHHERRVREHYARPADPRLAARMERHQRKRDAIRKAQALAAAATRRGRNDQQPRVDTVVEEEEEQQEQVAPRPPKRPHQVPLRTQNQQPRRIVSYPQ